MTGHDYNKLPPNSESTCKFEETVKADTPRLVVMFQLRGGEEVFQWGMVGTMPLLSLVGCVARVQVELIHPCPQGPHVCPQPALCIAWDAERRGFDYFVHPDIPAEPLVGMLETIKATLLGTHQARKAAAEQVGLLGPDGHPMRR